MGKKSAPPPAPDYAKAAEVTAASNQEAQTRADWTNRPNVNTPWGSQTWQSSAELDPATGKPITSWTQNTTLTPASQAALTSQQNVDLGKSQLAENTIGRVRDAYAQPVDWGNLQGMGGVPNAGGLQAGNLDANQYATGGAGQGIMAGLNTRSLGAMPDSGGDYGRQRIESALMARMQPENDRNTAALEGKLSNMGLTRGSEAWNRESQRLGDQQSRQAFDAMNTAGQEQQRQFGMQLQGRQQGWNELQGAGQFQNAAQAQGFGQNMGQNAQNFGQQSQAGAQNFGQEQAAGQQNYNQQMQSSQYANQLRQQQIAEMLQQRNQPLNEMNAVLTGSQVGMPQMPSFNTSQSTGGVNYSGAANQQYNAAMNAYNAQQQQSQGLMSGLGSVAKIAGPAMMMMSDRRLKRNIERVGMTQAGVPIYTFRYVWGRRRHLGVMADEAKTVCPAAVSRHWSGFLQVDYSKVV
jgi:hypothetical protein